MHDIVKIRKEEQKKQRELKPVAYEPMIWLPNISFNAKELPEIKECKVGQEYTMKIKVKMTSLSKNERTLGAGESKENTNASFDIMGVEMCEDK